MSTDAGTQVERDGLGDWRLQAAARLKNDIPAAYLGGPSHKAGAAVILTTTTATSHHPNLSFNTPSATALALSAGFRSAERAASLWKQIQYRTVVTPTGPGSLVVSTVVLFDYLEEALAAANSSFQAIEAFANATIAKMLKGTMAVKSRKNAIRMMNAEDIERQIPTSEKISLILPELLKVPTIKGNREWELFNRLKNVRDASTHFKSGDQYPGSGNAQRGSLYYTLLNCDPPEFPATAVRVISMISETPRHRWLTHLIEKYRIDAT